MLNTTPGLICSIYYTIALDRGRKEILSDEVNFTITTIGSREVRTGANGFSFVRVKFQGINIMIQLCD